MNTDKVIGALDRLLIDVQRKSNESPRSSRFATNDEFQMELGKVAYAGGVLSQLQKLKRIITETEGYKELRRSYKSSDGAILEEYIVGDGKVSKIVVFKDYTETKNSFNKLLKQIMKNDA